MDLKKVQQVNRLYKKSDQLLETGRFGQGLWPLDLPAAQFLAHVIISRGLKRGLEVGAGVGYSTVWMGQAFQQAEGKLLSLEYFPPKVEQLERHLQQVFGKNYGEFVEVVPSEYTRWLEHVGRKKFDLVFFDQRKTDYLPHLKMLMPHLKKGAYVCADNVISHRHECEDYLRFMQRDRRFRTATFPSQQGMEVSRFMGD